LPVLLPKKTATTLADFLTAFSLYWMEIRPYQHLGIQTSVLVFLSNDSEQEIERMAENFWKSPRVYNPHVVECLRSCQKSNCYTVVASATPMLFILPACKALGIEEVIATDLNFGNGRYLLGENCRGDEKLRRIKARFPDSTIREAYSDNFDDLGLLQSAEKGFVVNSGDVVPVKASGDAH